MEEDIITELSVLQGCLDKMMTRVEQHELALRRFQAFQRKLFALNSLPEVIDTVLTETKLFFALGSLTLTLCDEQATLASYLNYHRYAFLEQPELILETEITRFSAADYRSVYIGAYDSALHAGLFPETEAESLTVILIPLIRREQCLGLLCLNTHSAQFLPPKTLLNFADELGFSISLCLENQLNYEMNRQLKLMQALDAVNNRRFLEQRLTEELERGQRNHCSVSCLMLEVDFAPLEEAQAMQALETQVLTTVAETVKRQLRLEDVFSYYEGRKFAAFLTNVPEAVLLAIIQRLKTAIDEQVIHIENQVIPLDIFIAHADYPATTETDLTAREVALELIQVADSQLYTTKMQKKPQKKRLAT